MGGARNLRTLGVLSVVAVGMVGMSYAFVPLYNWFCRVTGFAGTTQQAEAGSGVVLDRTITVRFDASTATGFPWEFKPAQRTMEVRIGETALAYYEATNPTDRAVTGTASYNVAPFSTGGYFAKIDCFCFTEQTLEAGQTMQMPVQFFVDPAIMDDPEARRVPEITLSYTFYESEPPRAEASAATELAAAD